MALDMSKVKAQKEVVEERLTRGGGGNGAKFWRPSNGENRVRVMPGWATEGEFAGQFWREVAQHWNVSEDQRGPVLCPKKTPGLDGDCPICEFVDELRTDKTNVSSQELVREIRAKTTYLLSLVDYADSEYTANDVADFKKSRPDQECSFAVGDPKIQVYACPQTIFDQILGTVMTNQLDITDLEKGHDIIVKKHAHKDRLKTRYEVNLIVAPIASAVTAETTLIQLDKVGFVMKYDSLVELLQTGAGATHAKLPAAAEPAALLGDTASGADLEAKMRAELLGQ